MTRLMTLPAALALVLVAGCATQMDIAEGFVRLEEPGLYDVKAISADGVSIAARRVDIQRDSTLEFWSEAVGNDLASEGYSQEKGEEVISAAGEKGKLLWFSRELQGQRYTYATALYPSGGRLLLGEAGGPADAFEKHRAAVRKSLLSVR
jgi:hypothetical protein